MDSEVIEGVHSGEITHIALQINDDNQNMILENIDGNLVLMVDEMPETYHGCYYYNGGVFPYAIKQTLSFLVLSAGEETCLTQIIDVHTEPGTRFRFQGPGQPSIEDADGDSCLWEVAFEVVPVAENPRKYLMRWNPSISSFTEDDFEVCVTNMRQGKFRLNWSLYEWQKARRGDLFYMMRVGDDKSGIVFNGMFTSDPYPGDDWGGSSRRSMYVDLVCMNPVEAGQTPALSLDKLKAALPAVNWASGHSGVLLPDDVTERLDELWQD